MVELAHLNCKFNSIEPLAEIAYNNGDIFTRNLITKLMMIINN